MPKATVKAPGIEDFINNLTGRNRTRCVEDEVCATCGGEASDFTNDISRKEYTISGMCQRCQDEVFSNEGEWE